MRFKNMLPFKTLSDTGDISGKIALVRLDLNVPIVQGCVRDDFRIAQSLPTLSFLQKAGAKILVLAHIESVETNSLSPVFEHLKTRAETKDIVFAKTLSEAKTALETLPAGGSCFWKISVHLETKKRIMMLALRKNSRVSATSM